MGQTLFEKIWNAHVVADLGEGFELIHIDRHVVHDLSVLAFDTLNERGLDMQSPELTYAAADHSVPTLVEDGAVVERQNDLTNKLQENADKFNFTLFDVFSAEQGIVHVITPELGIALPGMTLACGDSHTCTIGALGALSWGVGQSEVVHILATQTSVQRRPKTMRIWVEGEPSPYVTAKDMILHIIGIVGVDGGTGYAVEFAGPAIAALGMEGRFTICNMAVELGARFGFIAPDETTFSYLKGRRFCPKGDDWDRARAYWQSLPTDEDAQFDKEIRISIKDIAPQVTWGTSPQDVIPVTGTIPDPATETDPRRKTSIESALSYTGLKGGAPLMGEPIDWVFIGSCSNARLGDLQAAAAIAKGRHVAEGVTAWVVPGSMDVKNAAEREGLDKIFKDAGFHWGSPGCSMCGGSGGTFTERVPQGKRALSTTNRNFIGRQGPGSLTHLVSPVMAVAGAVTGKITDVRELEGGA